MYDVWVMIWLSMRLMMGEGMDTHHREKCSATHFGMKVAGIENLPIVKEIMKLDQPEISVR